YFSFSCFGVPSDLHSFPTRRSSDLFIPFFKGCIHFSPFFSASFPESSDSFFSFRQFRNTESQGGNRAFSRGRIYIESSFYPSCPDRKSTRLNSSHVKISYAVFCLIK